MFVWIVQMLVEMEPRFQLNLIKIIFGDQALIDQILVDLGISRTTCLLHIDYHHLINEVWPHPFGTHLYQRICGDLDWTLLGSKQAEWELAYTAAKKYLLHDAEKFLALEKIYGNPSHFAGWYLKTIEENLLLNGSLPAEQNHASVAAHLGASASWSIVEQATMLLLWQTHLTAKRQEKNTQAFVGSKNYKSRLQDQAASDNEAAKKQLSHYAWDKLFLVEYKNSCRLRYVAHENVTVVWPNGEPQTFSEHIVIKGGAKVWLSTPDCIPAPVPSQIVHPRYTRSCKI
jgi:hypothetical protein